jgi:hypothetical protein
MRMKSPGLPPRTSATSSGTGTTHASRRWARTWCVCADQVVGAPVRAWTRRTATSSGSFKSEGAERTITQMKRSRPSVRADSPGLGPGRGKASGTDIFVICSGSSLSTTHSERYHEGIGSRLIDSSTSISVTLRIPTLGFWIPWDRSCRATARPRRSPAHADSVRTRDVLDRAELRAVEAVKRTDLRRARSWWRCSRRRTSCSMSSRFGFTLCDAMGRVLGLDRG